MFAFAAAMIFIIGGAGLFILGIAIMTTNIFEKVFGPGHDPYDYSLPQNRPSPYTDENGNRTGLGVTYP